MSKDGSRSSLIVAVQIGPENFNGSKPLMFVEFGRSDWTKNLDRYNPLKDF